MTTSGRRTRKELSEALASLVIESPALIRFNGQRVAVLPSPHESASLPGVPLIRAMQTAFYRECYCRPFGEATHSAPPAEAGARAGFLARLAAILSNRSRWDGGWNVYAAGPDGRVYVQKGERQRISVPGEFSAASAPGLPVRPGSAVLLWVQRDSAAVQPGFFHLFSDVLPDVWDEFDLFRIYFHTTSDGAPPLIQALTGALDRYRMPYVVKTLADPDAYMRADATVLYVARRYHRMALEIAADVTADGVLRAWTPLFTEPLAPGIAFADDPGGNESFGMHRCRLVAEGVWAAAVRGRQDLSARLDEIRAVFLRNGLDFERPHLGAGKTEVGRPTAVETRYE